AEDGIRDKLVTGVQTCALPILRPQQRDVLLGIIDRQHVAAHARLKHHRRAAIGDMLLHLLASALAAVHAEVDDPPLGALGHLRRSEERRVEKEWRSRWAP